MYDQTIIKKCTCKYCIINPGNLKISIGYKKHFLVLQLTRLFHDWYLILTMPELDSQGGEDNIPTQNPADHHKHDFSLESCLAEYSKDCSQDKLTTHRLKSKRPKIWKLHIDLYKPDAIMLAFRVNANKIHPWVIYICIIMEDTNERGVNNCRVMNQKFGQKLYQFFTNVFLVLFILSILLYFW